MTSQKDTLALTDDIITINTPSDTHYWCERLAVSPFTLFYLLKTVGNNATEIVEFLHKTDSIRLKQTIKPLKEFTIL
jgi:Protein of unknown function (DUF3606)